MHFHSSLWTQQLTKSENKLESWKLLRFGEKLCKINLRLLLLTVNLFAFHVMAKRNCNSMLWATRSLKTAVVYGDWPKGDQSPSIAHWARVRALQCEFRNLHNNHQVAIWTSGGSTFDCCRRQNVSLLQCSHRVWSPPALLGAASLE